MPCCFDSKMMGYANLKEELVEDDVPRKPKTDGLYNSYMIMSDSSLTQRDNELQHASDMSTESNNSSTVRVDIGDIDGEESLNLTTTTLKRCKQQVLRPYWRLLMFIGWRGFGRESVHFTSKRLTVLNVVYPIFVVCLLLYTYVYEIVACQWKLDLHKDTQVITTTTTTPESTEANISTTMTGGQSVATLTLGSPQNLTSMHWIAPSERPEACKHIITTYVIPNTLHFVAYIMGMVHFRLQENEQLYAIMEKVFLQATPSYSRTASQQKMIKKLRILMAVGAIWVAVTLVMQGLYEFAFDFPKLLFFKKVGMTVHWVLFSIELLGILILNSVTLAVIANYVTHCEMALFYLKGLALRLQEKSSELKAAMKDLLFIKQNVSLLNGPVARMTALISVIFAELTIIGIVILVLNKNDSLKVWIYRSFFPLVWLFILVAPLYQAARVNSVSIRMKKIALEMKVFGYKNSSQLELDSFILFVSEARMKAKLFHIPILPRYLIAVFVLGSFILLVLFQTSVIGPVNYWF
ncbi:uncharacterized protein LOC125659305 isoform X2 [Ostrea edulis]|uniref:uncharacterized protein LOC125659305 isoform X2 n=1 Tax=Ostrea edulis TaxID=37623 RepID=UPI0024AF20D7|nr:uncharacterized protein LOC125659305 isoform X2 [Ostrea edulis]